METHEGTARKGGSTSRKETAFRLEQSPGVAAELPTFSSSEEKDGWAGNDMRTTARKRVRLAGRYKALKGEPQGRCPTFGSGRAQGANRREG